MFTNHLSYFQSYQIPDANSLTDGEKTQVHFYRRLRSHFIDGPFNAILGPYVASVSSHHPHAGTGSSLRSKREDIVQRRQDSRTAARAAFNPFREIQKFSHKFNRPQSRLPDLTNLQFSMIFSFWKRRYLFQVFKVEGEANRGAYFCVLLLQMSISSPRNYG
jgi:hypothetical protein